MKLSGQEKLGAEAGFAVALFFPFAYGLWDFIVRKKFSFIAAIGFVGVLLKGGLGFFKFNNFWFAVNEAAIPTVIGVVLWVSVLVGRPLVGLFLLNDSIMNVDQIKAAINANQRQAEFDSIIKESTYLLVLSFFVSAVLNFVLAYYMLKSPVGTEAFNEEMGIMTAVSFPVIVLCSSSILVVALWRLMRRLKELTGMEYEAMFRQK
jgi:hypothetical protein